MKAGRAWLLVLCILSTLVLVGYASAHPVLSNPVADNASTSQATPNLASGYAGVVPAQPHSLAPDPLEPIAPHNIHRLTQLARWGEGGLDQLVYSPTGTLLAAATTIGVSFYDAESLDQIGAIETKAIVHSIAFSPDYHLLAAGLADGTVRLWRVEHGTPVWSTEPARDRVFSVAISHDGQLLAAGNEAGTVRLWRLSDLASSVEPAAEPVLVLDVDGAWASSLAFSPDGAILATATDRGNVQLWRANDCTSASRWCGRLLHTLPGHTLPVDTLAFSPDGLALASASRDDTVRIWNTLTGQLLHRFEAGEESALGIATSPGAAALVTGTPDGTVHVWSMFECASRPAECGSLSDHIEGLRGDVWNFALGPDGETLVSGSYDRTLRQWRVSDGEVLRAREGAAIPVDSLALSPDGTTVAIGQTRKTSQILLIGLQTGDLVQTLQSGAWDAMSMAFSPDGAALVTGAVEGAVRVWRMGPCGVEPAACPNPLHVIEEHDAPVDTLAFSPSGELFASGDATGNLHLWNAEDGTRVRSLQGHQDAIRGLAFSPGGEILASASLDGTVKLWLVRTGHLLTTLEGEPDERFSKVAFGPDGSILVSGSYDDLVRVWQLSDCAGQPHDCAALLHMAEVLSEGIQSMALSPDGSIVATGSWYGGPINLVGVKDGKLLETLDSHTAQITGLAFTPDGSILISGSVDGTVRLWAVGQE